jgi:hypothetical protein
MKNSMVSALSWLAIIADIRQRPQGLPLRIAPGAPRQEQILGRNAALAIDAYAGMVV